MVLPSQRRHASPDRREQYISRHLYQRGRDVPSSRYVSQVPVDHPDICRKHTPQPRPIQRYHRSSDGTTTTGGISRSTAMVLYQGKSSLAYNHPRGGLSLLRPRDTTGANYREVAARRGESTMRGMRLYCRSKVKLLLIVSSKPMNVMLYTEQSPYPLPVPLECGVRIYR